MVGNHTEGNVLLVIFLISSQSAKRHTSSSERGLYRRRKGNPHPGNNSQTLKSHAGIDILLDQLRVISVSVIVELGEYIVPYSP